MLCMSNHVEEVESQNNFRDPFNIHSIGSQLLERSEVSAFQNFLQIENPLNIKKVMSKTVKAYFHPFALAQYE